MIVNKKFKVIDNNLLDKLGFTNIEYNFTSNLEAEKTFDVRLPNKIFLLIKNLQDRPFGILNFNGASNCELNFKPQTINHLDLLFLDEYGEVYDFNELSYNLSFHISVLESEEKYINT